MRYRLTHAGVRVLSDVRNDLNVIDDLLHDVKFRNGFLRQLFVIEGVDRAAERDGVVVFVHPHIVQGVNSTFSESGLSTSRYI